MVGTGVSVPRNDGCCRDVLQEESPSGIPTGQLEREALKSVEASPSCTGSVHGKHAVIIIMKTRCIHKTLSQSDTLWCFPIVLLPFAVVSCKLYLEL